MYLTEKQFVYLYHYLAEAKLPPELEDLFKASSTPSVIDTPTAVYAATPNSQYKWSAGQGKYRISILAKNTPEFVRDNPTRVTPENEKSPFIGFYHASFTSPHDVVTHMQTLAKEKDLDYTEGHAYLRYKDKTGVANRREDPEVPEFDPPIKKDNEGTDALKETITELAKSFLNDLNESFTGGFAEPFPIHMPYKKLKKIASVMAGATSAGMP